MEIKESAGGTITIELQPDEDTVGEIVEIVYGLRKRATITAEFARRDRCF